MSHAYRADDAEDGAYGEWLDLVEKANRTRRVGLGSRVRLQHSGRAAVGAVPCRTGIDFSPVQIARARKLVPGATFCCAGLTTLAFPDESFAAITCLFALIHLRLAEQPALLRNVQRWLRPGGILMVAVGHPGLDRT